MPVCPRFPLFHLSKQKAQGQRAVHLPLCTSIYQCLTQITSTTEEISAGSSVIYWQPPPPGHRTPFLAVERDSLSRAPWPEKFRSPFCSTKELHLSRDVVAMPGYRSGSSHLQRNVTTCFKEALLCQNSACKFQQGM